MQEIRRCHNTIRLVLTATTATMATADEAGRTSFALMAGACA
jgi:hypothetical protein